MVDPVIIERDKNIEWAFKMQCLMSYIEMPFCDAFRTGTFIKSWKDEDDQ